MPAGRTVLLLDLFARADGFVAGDAFGALAAHLGAAGHAVVRARLVAGDLPDQAAFLERIVREARASQADVAVLARAWDRALVEAVRAGLPGASLVRLTNGVRAAIDDAFDHVLDPAGLFALLAGDASPAPAEFHRTTAADLRRRLAMAGPEHAYTSASNAYTSPGDAYTSPGDAYTSARAPATKVAAPSLSGRPTISGPSSGCPFLLDARTSPAFAGVDLDPERIQTKGCTFCLDNFGAYVVPKQADVVAAWLDGLRRVRAARPDAREILLTDERPHPFLPAFFEALAAAPDLAPVELLWKSRADWLLEFAADVERACELAERSGSVVHLYLVGFESFDRAHLDLFNKGHGPDLNEAAIAKMRELQARFPRSFEHRRLRSHGIVLFTPWTTPEALLENARWMRRLRFHELRSEAIKTRLRLYPRVPLHHLAEREGLLAERFEPGRGDRAAEQGYDASVPWRFRDPRTEAIFQLANALHELDRSVTDADLLEVATRFVLRWPGLADVPHLAHLPVRAAIEAWGAPLSFLLENLGPAATAFDPEIEAIGRTSKRASLKESVRGADAEDMARAYRAMGFAAEVVFRHGMDRSSGDHFAGGDHAVLCVAHGEPLLDAVLRAQRSLVEQRGRSDEAAVRELGAHMGYPECCVAAFAGLPDRGDNLANERAPFARHPDAPLHPLLHRTGAVRLVSHHLCSPACATSVAEAERVMDLLRAADPDAPDRVLALLRAPSLFLDYDRFASLHGRWEQGAFQIERVIATGRATGFERELGVAVTARVEPRAVTLRLADTGERVVPADRPLLVVPGQPLAPVALAALAGPAAPSARARRPAAPGAGAPARATPSVHPGGVRAPATAPGAPARATPPAQPAGAPGPAARVPELPAALRPGLRAAAYTIAGVDSADTGHTVWLARGAERFAVRLRAHADGAPYTLRKGRWAIDLDDPHALGEPARAAIGLLVRALPPW